MPTSEVDNRAPEVGGAHPAAIDQLVQQAAGELVDYGTKRAMRDRYIAHPWALSTVVCQR